MAKREAEIYSQQHDMKRLLAAAVVAIVSTPSLWALSVTITAGGLEDAVTDLTITELTVSGTMDVRDFSFMAENLTSLTTLDISGVAIEAYTCSATESYFAERGTFAANAIPLNSFFGSGLTSVVLPSTLTEIGEGAFAGCSSLTSVDIPSAVTTIGEGAFYASGITSASIAAATIGDNAFTYCTSLAEVTLAATVETIGAAAFAGCTSLSSVTIASGCALTTIGDEAFAQTAITTFDFTNCTSVKSIGTWVFAGAPLSTAKLPSYIEDVPDGTFFGNSAATDIALPAATVTIGDYAFYGCNGVDKMTLTQYVTYIGDNAFENTYFGEVIATPTQVPELGEDVFKELNTSDHQATLYVYEVAYSDYKAAAQWCEFNIETIENSGYMGTGTPVADLTAVFNDKVLQLTADEMITRVTVADETGITISYNDTADYTVYLDTSRMMGHVYIVRATLASGAVSTLKLMRK